MAVDRTRTMEYLDQPIEATTMAMDATPQGHPDRFAPSNNLRTWLGGRPERTGSMGDLSRAVDVADKAVGITPQDHPDRAGMMTSLAVLLGRPFERTGSMDTLNLAIDITDMTLDDETEDHPDQAAMLKDLTTWLGMRFLRTGSMDDLNRAIDVAGKAVDATPEDHPDRAATLHSLGTWLGTRFERTESMDDLNCAVDVADEAIGITPQDHPHRPSRLINLGIFLGRRFRRTGSIDDLNRAVDVADKAVDATPEDHPDREHTLNNLGIQLGTRFKRTGSMDDLNRAINIANKAVDITTQHDADRASMLTNLGALLSMRFERTRSIDDLNRGVDVAEKAVDATPEDHPYQANTLYNLGSWLSYRSERTGSMDDLNRAVDVVNKAVDATPQHDHNRAYRLTTLGATLGRRSERTGSMDDLNRAIDVANKAVDATPQDRPDRADCLNNLGVLLGMRYLRTSLKDDLNRVVSSYKEGWNCRAASPSIRIDLARRAAGLLAAKSHWEESSQLLQEAVKLLPAVSPRVLQHTDKQHMLADFAGLASMAAATALNAGEEPYHALQLLERGRDVIAGLLMEMRGDISELEPKHPGLANKFKALRDELDKPADALTSPISNSDTPSWESQAKRRHEVDREFNDLIGEIRAQPGFANFLLPPTTEKLMAAADPDPIVVVNLSSYRCDAFLIERDKIRVLKLPGLTLKDVQERARNLRLSGSAATFRTTPMLEWLWDAICRPVLDTLGLDTPVSGDNWPRVWWIPTGSLSQLPLHAAGRHTQRLGETVLDRVMSSYASSVKALLYGRRQQGGSSIESKSNRALLVAMRQTPGLTKNGILPFAWDEVEMLNRLCPSLGVDPIAPALRKDVVLHHLQSCRIFHFAGHGRSDPMEPSRSCLLLDDWETDPLTAGDLRDHKLYENPPFLAYLSACSTGANEAEKLADEGIHLVSAFRLAGFRHVVGTLWEVSDRHCVDVARVLYKTMGDEGMTDVAVCRGLHRAVRALRDEWVETEQAVRIAEVVSIKTRELGLTNPYWVPYIHFGV
ncbi:CHAT domain-containing protein [Parachaetomium inaequale]|uniref:CHAT domain-containing protein n=1 Tax=Parachaetomium inaequale TaxID=2588326 RepID=A0AAN6P8X9_9PEZI|nr:CHAT domain-containing protein [Parachaetomium inaequale]